MVGPVSSVQEYFDTLDERLVKDAAKGVTATFQYDLTGDSGGTWTVAFNDGEMSVTPGPAEKPNVLYTMKADDYVKMVNGELDGTKAFMMRKLKVKGNVALAQKMKKFLPPLDKKK